MAKAPSSPVLQQGPDLRKVLLSISRQTERDFDLLSSLNSERCVHTLRVRMKKLRAVLRLIEPGVAPTTMKVIRRRVRTIKKAFAMNRDQHVLNALLSELCDGRVTCHKEWIARKEKADPSALPSPAKRRRLKVAIRALTHQFQTMRICPLAWDDVAEAYARRYAKARQWFRRCERKPSADRLHRWRVPVKDHFFQSLLVLPDRDHIEDSRKLGSLLGRMHDLVMLREQCNQGAPESLIHAILSYMERQRTRIFRKARQVFVLPPKKLGRKVRAAHCAG